jgi:ankyrin repeat protein
MRSPKATRTALKKFPKGSEAYNYAYEEAMERVEGQITNSRDLAKQVLSWITCARRPLTTLELRHALGVEIGESKLDEENLPEVEDMISVCAGLVTVDEQSDIIRLVHYTTQEYFERTWTSWFPNAQADIAITCVTYLSFDTFETGFCPTVKDFATRLQLNPLYDYAARNWVHHTRLASTEVEQLIVGFLESGAKVSASSQAMMAFGIHPPYRWPILGVHLAAYLGLTEVVIALLKNGHDPDPKDNSNRTPLSWAVEGRHEAMVTLLVEEGAELESKDNDGGTPLSWAAKYGSEVIVKLLIEKGTDLESKDNNGRTPLSWAAEYGHEAVVKLLVEKGAELESKDNNGQTPLLWAAKYGSEAVVKLLVEKGAKLESKDNGGRAPLSWAAEYRREAEVKLLVEKGAELESKDNKGQTPLSWAAACGGEAVVKLLVERGAELESKDNKGQTPLSWAAVCGSEAVVKLLVERGAELESKDNKGQTPLSWAAEYGGEAVVKLLIEKGAELESNDSMGRTPLCWAAAKGYEAVVRLLLAKDGVNPDSKDEHSRTPLWYAAANEHEAVVRLLLAKGGVDLDSKDSSGWTPLSRAVKKGNPNVVKLLFEKYGKKGIAIREEDLAIATPPVAYQESRIFCDICISNIPDVDIHHHCRICDNGDFDICQECIVSGAFCLDYSHKLVRRIVREDSLVEVPD